MMYKIYSTKAMKRIIFLLLAAFFLSGCVQKVPEKVKKPEDALVLCKGWWRPEISDDMEGHSLKTAVEKSIEYLKRLPPRREFVYGTHKYNAEYLIESMNVFLTVIAGSSSSKDLNRRIRRHFNIYKSVGSNKKGSVLFTAYYEPLLKGSLKKFEEYKYPIYMKPDDLMVINLEQFSPRFKGERIVARYDDNRVIPYYGRKEIDVEKVLEGRGLELIWISSPVELFFLQIQGSGVIELEDGAMQRVHYAASNGRPYRSIGRKIIAEKKIPRDKISLQSIKAYLRDHPKERDRIFNHNESYIFFEKVDRGPLGNIEVVLTPGRSIATDYRLFPRGGLAFISTEKPEMDQYDRVVGWKKFSRLVVNQDTGGAIRGPGRVDVFWGTGENAGIEAGTMQQRGELYFLVRKPSK